MKGILCFGDSITFGRGDNANLGWCGRLKEYFDGQDKYHGVYNLGIPGDTTEGLLRRFDCEAESRIKHNRLGDKYLILIAIGTNDSKKIVRDGNEFAVIEDVDFGENILRLIEKARSFNATLGFIGLPPLDESKVKNYEDTSFSNERIKLFNDIIMKICEMNEIPFVDINEIMNDSGYLDLLEDGLHPNSEGYRMMFEIISSFIEEENLI